MTSTVAKTEILQGYRIDVGTTQEPILTKKGKLTDKTFEQPILIFVSEDDLHVVKKPVSIEQARELADYLVELCDRIVADESQRA